MKDRIRVRGQISVLEYTYLLSECTIITSTFLKCFLSLSKRLGIENIKHTVWRTMGSFMILLKKRKNKYLYFHSGSAQYILASHLLWFIYILLNSVFVHHSKHKKKSTTTKSPQKMLSDEIAKKMSTWISEATSKCILMWQLHLFSSCPRINCTAEIRHPACSMQTEAQAGSKLWITTLPSDSFHMATFLTFPSIFYPTAVWLWQKMKVGMTGTSVVSGREWKQQQVPLVAPKSP